MLVYLSTIFKNNLQEQANILPPGQGNFTQTSCLWHIQIVDSAVRESSEPRRLLEVAGQSQEQRIQRM